jgi:hypothetical protein
VVSGIAHPVPVWSTEAERQFRLARQSAAQTARLYADAGFAVAIDDVISIDDARALLIEPLSCYTVHALLIHPSLDIALERNARRTNKQFDTAILAGPIVNLHGSIDPLTYAAAGWIVVDNSALSLDETIDRIFDELNRRRHS